MQQLLQVCSVLSLQRIPWICPTLLYQKTKKKCQVAINYAGLTVMYWPIFSEELIPFPAAASFQALFELRFHWSRSASVYPVDNTMLLSLQPSIH